MKHSTNDPPPQSARPPTGAGDTNPGAAYLTTGEAASYVRLSVSTLAKLRMTGGGAGFRKLGRKVLYCRADLDAWLESHRRRSTSEARQ